MNWLDVVLGLILLLSVAGGLVKGFARVGIGLAATIAGVILALWFYGSAGAFLQPYLSSRGLANFAGFCIVIFAVGLAGAFAGWVLSKLMKHAGLGWLDRLLGGAAGLVRGLVIGIALIMALMAFAVKPPPKSVSGSRLAPYVIEASRVMAAMAPRELKDGFQASYDQIKKIWAETWKRGLPRLPAREI